MTYSNLDLNNLTVHHPTPYDTVKTSHSCFTHMLIMFWKTCHLPSAGHDQLCLLTANMNHVSLILQACMFKWDMSAYICNICVCVMRCDVMCALLRERNSERGQERDIEQWLENHPNSVWQNICSEWTSIINWHKASHLLMFDSKHGYFQRARLNVFMEMNHFPNSEIDYSCTWSLLNISVTLWRCCV